VTNLEHTVQITMELFKGSKLAQVQHYLISVGAQNL